MKKQTSLITLGLMLVTPALAGGAGAPAAPAAGACKSLAQIVATDPNFSTLATALEAAGLVDTLKGGEYTVFAPTNAAFAKLPSDTLAAVLNDTELLTSILLYHVAPGKVAAADVIASTSINTVQGSALLVTVQGNKVMVDNANVTRANVMACNGIAHVIDAVLLPAIDTAEAPAAEAPAAEAPAAEAPAAEAPAAEAPAASGAPAAIDISQIPALPLSGATVTTTTTTETTTTETTTEAAATTETATETPAGTTIYDVVLADDRFSTLRDLLSDAGLTETLLSGEYTVFAPTNEAFDAIDPDTLALIASDAEALKQVLLYHVVAGRVAADKLSAETTLTSAGGGAITLGMDGSTQMVGEASVSGAPVEASNGLIYVINKVLLPPGFEVPAAPVEEPAATLVSTLQGQAQFSTLVDLVVKAGLADTLLSGDYTVFAPTNDAFAKVPKATLDALAADPAKLKQVLLFHVVSGKVAGDGLKVAQLRSAEGSSIDLKVSGDSYQVGVLSGDTITGGLIATGGTLEAGNSVVYTIDTVLLPPSLK